MKKVYTSKIDTWLVVVLLGTLAACVIAFLYSLRTGDIIEKWVTLPALIIGGGLPVWLMKSTRYTLSDRALFVKSGSFKWHVPIDQITYVTPTSNPISSPALSLDRLRIEYGDDKSIIISPKEKSKFIQDLETCRGNNG